MTVGELFAANAICKFIMQQYWTGYYLKVMAMGGLIRAERKVAAVSVAKFLRSFGPP